MTSLRKVSPGEPLQIRAADYNAFVDAARDLRQRQLAVGQTPQRAFAQSGIILARNDSPDPQPRFAVLGLDQPIVPPQDSPEEFQRQIAFACVVPTEAHRGRFVILAEPLAVGAIGRAYAAGVCPVKVDFVSALELGAADIEPGETGYLTAQAGGAAALLWPTVSLGRQWALVRFSGTSGDRLPEIAFRPELRQNEEGHLRLYVAAGRARARGGAAQDFPAAEFVPFWNHVVYLRRDYPTCDSGGAWTMAYGPEPDETLDCAILALCRVGPGGGTDDFQLHVHHLGDVEIFDVIRRVPVDAFEEPPEEDTTPPEAEAGPDQTVVIGATLVFDGTGSSDNVGLAAYEWSLPGGGTLYGPRPAHRFTQAGVFPVTLTVRDAKGNEATDTLTVTVVDPEEEP